MLGTIVNSIAILIGSLIGILFKHGIPEKLNSSIMKSVGLSVMLIGLLNALKVNNLMLLIFSMLIGTIIGELIDIDKRLNIFGNKLERRFKGNNISEGFVTATLLFCVGSMAIIGSIESGLTGNHQTLFAKSILDGTISILFASSLGIGVAISAISVFIYQGTITLSASFLKDILTANAITDISAVGGLLIISIGINMIFESKIKTANLLPAIFLPGIYYAVLSLFQ
ncbi:DUF554 domain-containing protein [Helicovermis profundi]|uniref:DUF554 domain-containing protein n=1 Tax=Helicovermis profundi TaxID=3065157 RepID=A0AAU9E4D8_9FIRM|nr:DUF554 domain-containing protein [Clostridia bacterium S502]